MNAMKDYPSLNHFDEVLNREIKPMSFQGSEEQRSLGLKKVAELRNRIRVFNQRKAEQVWKKKQTAKLIKLGLVK